MDNKEKIIKELKKNPDGFTVSELSKKLNIYLKVVEIHLMKKEDNS